MTANPASFAAQLGGGSFAPWTEAFRWLTGRSDHTLPALVLAWIEPLATAMPSRARSAIEAGIELRRAFDDALGDDGVLLYPSFPTTAPRHDWPILTHGWTTTSIWNVMELPVTQVPLGFDREGLPLGVQVVAGHGNDHLTIAVALELERAFGGWTPPLA